MTERRKWITLAFLCAIFVFYTVDRAMLGLLAVSIQGETGLSDVEFGVLSAAIFWTYAVCAPFSGLAGDRFNRMRLIGLAAAAWSFMTFIAGFANGFWSLLMLVSVAVVAPQSLYSPSANALIAEQHVATRTIALSCHQSAYYVGWFASGAAVATVLGLCGSWRGVFFSFGIAGLVLAVAFLAWGRMARRAEPAGSSLNVLGKCSLMDSFRAFFCCRTAVLVSVCYVMEVFVAYGYSSWAPKFIALKFSISPSAAGTGVMFWHYATSFAAILLAGVVTDRLVVRMQRFRMGLSVGALVASIPALVLFGLSDSLHVVWGAAALLGGAIGVIGANQFAMVFDVVPSCFRAGCIGFLNVMAALVGSVSLILLGWLSGKYGIHGFEIGFSAMSGLQVVPIAALLLAMALTFERDAMKMRPLERKFGNE